MRVLIIGILTYFCIVSMVYAGMYKWVDENGVTHYSNVAPAQNQEVEEQSEIKSSPQSTQTSTGLEEITNSYERENIKQDLNSLKKKKSSSKSTTNENLADYYEHRIKEEETIVQSRYEDLAIVKRESYSDSRKHKEKVRRYEGRYERSKLELERVKKEYRKAKYGQ